MCNAHTAEHNSALHSNRRLLSLLRCVFFVLYNGTAPILLLSTPCNSKIARQK